MQHSKALNGSSNSRKFVQDLEAMDSILHYAKILIYASGHSVGSDCEERKRFVGWSSMPLALKASYSGSETCDALEDREDDVTFRTNVRRHVSYPLAPAQ